MYKAVSCRSESSNISVRPTGRPGINLSKVNKLPPDLQKIIEDASLGSAADARPDKTEADSPAAKSFSSSSRHPNSLISSSPSVAPPNRDVDGDDDIGGRRQPASTGRGSGGSTRGSGSIPATGRTNKDQNPGSRGRKRNRGFKALQHPVGRGRNELAEAEEVEDELEQVEAEDSRTSIPRRRINIPRNGDRDRVNVEDSDDSTGSNERDNVDHFGRGQSRKRKLSRGRQGDRDSDDRRGSSLKTPSSVASASEAEPSETRQSLRPRIRIRPTGRRQPSSNDDSDDDEDEEGRNNRLEDDYEEVPEVRSRPEAPARFPDFPARPLSPQTTRGQVPLVPRQRLTGFAVEADPPQQQLGSTNDEDTFSFGLEPELRNHLGGVESAIDDEDEDASRFRGRRPLPTAFDAVETTEPVPVLPAKPVPRRPSFQVDNLEENRGRDNTERPFSDQRFRIEPDLNTISNEKIVGGRVSGGASQQDSREPFITRTQLLQSFPAVFNVDPDRGTLAPSQPVERPSPFARDDAGFANVRQLATTSHPTAEAVTTSTMLATTPFLPTVRPTAPSGAVGLTGGFFASFTAVPSSQIVTTTTTTTTTSTTTLRTTTTTRRTTTTTRRTTTTTTTARPTTTFATRGTTTTTSSAVNSFRRPGPAITPIKPASSSSQFQFFPRLSEVSPPAPTAGIDSTFVFRAPTGQPEAKDLPRLPSGPVDPVEIARQHAEMTIKQDPFRLLSGNGQPFFDIDFAKNPGNLRTTQGITEQRTNIPELRTSIPELRTAIPNNPLSESVTWTPLILQDGFSSQADSSNGRSPSQGPSSQIQAQGRPEPPTALPLAEEQQPIRTFGQPPSPPAIISTSSNFGRPQPSPPSAADPRSRGSFSLPAAASSFDSARPPPPPSVGSSFSSRAGPPQQPPAAQPRRPPPQLQLDSFFESRSQPPAGPPSPASNRPKMQPFTSFGVQSQSQPQQQQPPRSNVFFGTNINSNSNSFGSIRSGGPPSPQPQPRNDVFFSSTASQGNNNGRADSVASVPSNAGSQQLSGKSFFSLSGPSFTFSTPL